MHAGLRQRGVAALQRDAEAAVGVLQEFLLLAFGSVGGEGVQQPMRLGCDASISFDHHREHLVSVLFRDSVVLPVLAAAAVARGEQRLADDSGQLEVAGGGGSTHGHVDVEPAVVLHEEDVCMVVPPVGAGLDACCGGSSVVVGLSAGVESHTACEVHQRLHEVVVALRAEGSTVQRARVHMIRVCREGGR